MQPLRERLEAQLVTQVSAERTTLVRNTFLAGGALATAILIALTQTGAKEISLKIAIIACAISAPVWLCLAAAVEAHLHLGDELKVEFVRLRTGRIYGGLQLVAALSLYAALCSMIYFLLPAAMYTFVGSSIIGAAYVAVVYARLARHWVQRASDTPSQAKTK